MNKYLSILMTSALVCGFTACEDRDDEITDVLYSRVFSPSDVKVKIRNNVDAEITWTENVDADNFVIEIYTDEARTQLYRTEQSTALTKTIKGLEGETTYYARIYAQKEGVTGSKWTNFEIKTEPEQTAVLEDKKPKCLVGKYDATVYWTPGVVADIISWGEGDDHQRAVTEDEIAAGCAKITGLNPEHRYTIKYLKANGKQRAKWDVQTNPLGWPASNFAELEEAFTLITPEDNQILIDGIVASVELNEEGAQKTKTITLPQVEGLTVVSFKSASADAKGIIKGVNIKVPAGMSLEMTNIVLDGKFVPEGKEEKDGSNNGDQAIVMLDGEGTVDHIILDGCEVKNYTKGVIYGNVAVPVGKILFNNCRFYDIECSGGDLFDFRKTAAAEFIFTNNTVYNCATAGRDCFRMDAGGNTVVPAGTITITNNTFDKVSDNASKRLLYIRLGETFPINFSNNIVSNTKAYITNQSTTVIAKMENNNYFNAAAFLATETANAQVDPKGISVDPAYADPANGDYSIGAESLVDAKIGDLD
ncbi:MAG: DUF4957 domain-containing protein [Marinilabiliaceae bacterium]|nr:DUF4957 domain-containing protein [Marinilabiliaceae bacterium]